MAVRALPDQLGASVAAAHAHVWIKVEDRLAGDVDVPRDQLLWQVEHRQRAPDSLVDRNRVRIVFEGIEQLWQLELSESAGATYVQGYALARPEIAPTTFGRFAESKVQTARDALRAAALQVTTEDQPGIGYGHRAA